MTAALSLIGRRATSRPLSARRSPCHPPPALLACASRERSTLGTS